MSQKTFKQDMIDKVHARFGGELSKRQAEDALNHVIDMMKGVLEEDGEIRIAGFGTFKVVERAPRKGHNPQTGESIDIPARNAVTFKPAKALKEMFND